MAVVWSEEAARNLEEIGDYIAPGDRRAATLIVDRILKSTALLENHPFMGRSLGTKGDRQLVVPGTKYIVQYAFAGRTCEILAVFHSSRHRPHQT